MAKTVELPLRVYEDLEKAAEELSLMAKKPISVPMALDMLMEVYKAHLSNPCVLDRFSVQVRTSNLMSPEEFMRYWDEPQTPTEVKPKPKTEKPKKTK